MARTESRSRFRERLPQLAQEVVIARVDDRFARDLYAHSEAAHGAQVSMFHVEPTREETAADEELEQSYGEPEPPKAASDVTAPLAIAQELVRTATRKAIEDGTFRQIFWGSVR